MPDFAELRGVVERFVAGAGRPAVLDPGEEPILLIAGQWTLSEWGGRLVLEAWDSHRNLVRKIARVREERRDRLALVTERFPKLEAELQIADLASALGTDLERKTSRAAFRERFQLMLAREFAAWRVEEVSIDLNLEESLTASYARAFLRHGNAGVAAMAAPPDCPDCPGIVACGLIWLDYLRRREPKTAIGGLVLYVPLRQESGPAARLKWLDPTRVDCRLFGYDGRDRIAPIDPADAGNIDSILPPCRRPAAPNAERRTLAGLPEEVDCVEQSDGTLSLRIRGLEFGRVAAGKLSAGIARRTRCSPETVASMAREIERVRNPENGDRQHPLYSMNPEGWLESQIRADPGALDASLRAEPIYGQAPVLSGGDRGVIDLLAIDHTGRLAVIEIKAAADLQLPFQAVDYWMRVRKHLEAGDFGRLGYFAGQMIKPEPPRILLAAPALEFHSTIDALIGYLRPEVEVTRIGLAADWRNGLRVMFRLRGSERPLI